MTAHPHCPNLYLATGGSFHGWKFLPIIGKYVVLMLRGELDDEMKGRWDWEKSNVSNGDGAHGGLWPRRELLDLAAGAGGSMKAERAKL